MSNINNLKCSYILKVCIYCMCIIWIWIYVIDIVILCEVFT